MFGYAQGETGSHPVLQAVLPDNSTSTFDTWKAALEYANKQERCTLRLLDDIDLDTLKATQYVNKELVLDLNGHTLSAEGTTKYYRFLSPRDGTSSLSVTSSSGGSIVFSSSSGTNLQTIYAPKGKVSLRNIRIESLNYEGTSSTNRYATAVYAGQDVPVELYEVQIKTKSQGSGYGIQSRGVLIVEKSSISVETTLKSTAYGINVKATAEADIAKCYAASLRMKETDITVSTASNTAYGVYASAKSVLLDTVINGNKTIRMGARLHIENSHISVTAAGKTATGVTGGVGYNSLHGGEYTDSILHTDVRVSASSGATSLAMGLAADKTTGARMSSPVVLESMNISVSAAESSATALSMRAAVMPVTMRNSSIEAKAGSTAYGVQGSGTITFRDGTIQVATDAGTTTYGLYVSKGGVDLRNVQLSCMNYEGVYSGKRSASSLYAGQDVSVKMRDVQIETKAETSVYGVQTGGDLTIDNGKINVSTTSGSSVYGVYLKAAAEADSAKCYAASLRMKETEITVHSANSNAYGVYATSKGIAADTATGDTDMFRMGARVYIEGGRISAAAVRKTAQAVTMSGAYNSLQGKVYADTIRQTLVSATSDSTATAIVLLSSGDKKTGVTLAPSVWLDNVKAQASAGKYSAVALSVRGSEVVLSGEHYASGATAVIEGGTYKSTAQNLAYGLSASVSGLTMQTESSYPHLTISDARFDAKAKMNARALSLTAQTEMQGSTLYASTDSTNAYSVYLTNGSFRADSVRLTSQAYSKSAALYNINGQARIHRSNLQTSVTNITAYGIYVSTSISDSLLLPQATLYSEDNDVSVTVSDSTSAYGYYLAGSKKKIAGKTYVSNSETSIIGGRCKVAATDKSYCVYLSAPIEGTDSTVAARCRIDGGEYMVEAYNEAAASAAVVNKSATKEDLQIENGFFSHKTNLQAYVVKDKYLTYTSWVDSSLSDLPYMVIDGSDERWGVCRIEETFFQTLEDALLYANMTTRPSTIVMLQNYTLPQGEYVIPRQTVLLIPSDMDQDYGYGINGERTSENNLTAYPFLRLTLDDGVNMRCEGRIEASGRQHTNKSPHGSVYASYGVLELKRDARLVIEADGTLISWGFVTGEGQVEVLKGGTTYEPFQIGDWKGGNVAADLFERKEKIFIFNQYFVQNIEAPTTYRYGAKALGVTCLNSTVTQPLTYTINVVGQSESIFDFHAGDRSTVSRRYDAQTDRMTWELYDASIGSFYIDFGEVQINSRQYVLPIPNNYTIYAASDTVGIIQDVFIAPGAQLHILPSATFLIPSSTRLYLYAEQDWGIYSSKRFSYSPYSPSWDKNPRDTILDDAQMYVGGDVVVRGSLHTTRHIARVFSDDVAQGSILYESDATQTSTIYQLVGQSMEYEFQAVRTEPVLLTNANGSQVTTAGSSAGVLWQYTDGIWTQLLTDNKQVENDADKGQYSSSGQKAHKRIINGHLYIISGDKVFTPLGGRIKRL